MNAIAIHADWIVPVSAPPIRNGWLVAVDGWIEHVGPTLPERFATIKIVHLANQIIVPGMLNMHCHMEFSDLEASLPFSGSFIRWIGSVVRHRREQTQHLTGLANVAEVLEERRLKSLSTGLREAYLSGARYVLDTVTEPWSEAFLKNGPWLSHSKDPVYQALVADTPFYYQPCPEVLDINQTRSVQTCKFAEKVHLSIDEVRESLATGCTDANISLVGGRSISPHAPYTASLRLIEQAVSEAILHQGIVSIHLAESEEERAWLMSQSGPIEDALKDFRDSEFTYEMNKMRSILASEELHTPFGPYLKSLSGCPKTLLAHGNQFSDEELMSICEKNRNAGAGLCSMAIVHCPRTYKHFHPDPQIKYPLEDRLKLGVPHFLGTDSKASNPDLDLWQEVLQVIDQGLLFEKALALVTTAPAGFLGVEDFGSIQIGSRSLLTAVQLTEFGQVDGKVDDNWSWEALLDGSWSKKVSGRCQALPLEIAASIAVQISRQS